MTNSDEYVFVIPTFNPDERLMELIKNFLNESNNTIFIVNDGSFKEESKEVIQKIKEMNVPKLKYLEHHINLGKGAAFKTVFNDILVNYPHIKGIVTLDSDGQHSIKDCLTVLENIKKVSNGFVLGYREFSKDIPLKSYIGNNISKAVYKVILGHGFKDTQTGLRGLSREFMKECLKIKSNRFDFETEQLAIAVNKKIPIIEIPIETIYIEENKTSSFRPLIDSFRIYFVLLRYAASSILTAIVDLIVFLTVINFGGTILFGNFLARTMSIGVQFILLDKFVFYSKEKLSNFILFTLYVYIMGVISALAQISAVNNLGFSVIMAKVLVEGFLFFVNFSFLRLYIFKRKEA